MKGQSMNDFLKIFNYYYDTFLKAVDLYWRLDMRKKEIEKTVNQLKELTEAIGAINQAQVQLKELIEIIEPMYDTLDKLEKICPKTANED